MHQNDKDILHRYLNGMASDEERTYVESWYQNITLFRESSISDDELIAFQHKSSESLAHHMSQSKQPVKRRWGVISVATVAIGLSVYLMVKESNLPLKNELPLAEQVVPGTMGATLTLAGGQTIALNTVANGSLAQQGGIKISKTGTGELVYQVTGDSENQDTGINTLTTAPGQTFVLVLPDRSRVWLNAASSISYSSTLLQHGIRRVSLQGEAYFQVAKDTHHPFIVSTSDQQVQVLGTHFNINSYADKASVTTLLEGSVKVSSNIHKQWPSVTISPGQQALASEREIQVSAADTTEIVAWKNGYFQFEAAELSTIMQQVARWYNVEVVYEGTPSRESYHLKFPRNQQLSNLIAVFSSYGINIKTEGRRLIVKE